MLPSLVRTGAPARTTWMKAGGWERWSGVHLAARTKTSLSGATSVRLTDEGGGGSKNCKGFASCIKTIVCIYGCRHRDTAAVSPPVTSLFAPSINTDRFDWH